MADIKHQLDIGASPEKIYEAITSQEGLSNWWAVDTRAKPEVGSVTKFGFNKRRTVFEMEVKELTPPSKIRWACNGGHPEWEGTRLEFEITETEKGSSLLFSHLDWESTDGIYPMCSYDWAGYLYSLRMYCETGEGLPHPE